MTDWNQIKEEYAAGGVSYRMLAERHGISYGSLSRRARKENWARLKGEQMFFDGVFSDKEYAASKVVEIADKLLGRMSELVDGMENPDTQSIKQLSSALKDLRDIRTYGSELALRKAKLRKLEREAETEDGSDEIEVVFDAGEDCWNE